MHHPHIVLAHKLIQYVGVFYAKDGLVGDSIKKERPAFDKSRVVESAGDLADEPFDRF